MSRKAAIPLFLLAVIVPLLFVPDMALAAMPEYSGSDVEEFFFTVVDALFAPTVILFACAFYITARLCKMHREHAAEIEHLNAFPGEFKSQSWKKRKVGVGKILGRAFVKYLIALAIFGLYLYAGIALGDALLSDLPFLTSKTTLGVLVFMIFFAYPFLAVIELAFAKFENDWYKKLVAIFGNKWQREELAQR